MFNTDERALLWFNTFNISTKKKNIIVDLFSSPSEMFSNFRDLKEDILQIIDVNTYNQINMLREKSYVDKIINDLKTKNVNAVTIASDEYPKKLKDYLYDPPLVIYYKGDLSLINEDQCIAIVGSRKTTRYGQDVTKKFAKELSFYNFCIVSGLARGVDTIAHKECLENDGRTIAVLGCGIDVVYPSENRELYDEIAEKGLLITEFPLGTSPLSYNFPQRNRIISAISDSVLVTEAGEKSGTMITVNYAIDFSKDLFVVPGNITSEMSIGTNNLIKNRDNVIITTNINDILTRYDMKPRTIVVDAIQLDFIQQCIIDYLADGKKHLHEIMNKANINLTETINLLTGLKSAKLIRQIPGNFYELQPK